MRHTPGGVAAAVALTLSGTSLAQTTKPETPVEEVTVTGHSHSRDLGHGYAHTGRRADCH